MASLIKESLQFGAVSQLKNLVIVIMPEGEVVLEKEQKALYPGWQAVGRETHPRSGLSI